LSESSDTAGLVAAMRAAQIIDVGAPNPPDQPRDRPWFILLMQGAVGWVAGLLMLVFIGLIWQPDTTPEILTVGIFLSGGAWALYFIDRDNVFLDQLALAISIAGQLALAWALLKDMDSPSAAALTLLALQVAVFFIMPNHVARTVATFFACIAWAYFIRLALWPGHGVDSFFDGYGRARMPVFGAWTMPVAWLLTWAPIIALNLGLLVNETHWMARGARVLARPALTGALLGAALGSFTAEPLWTTLFGAGSGFALSLPLSWWSLFPLLSIVTTLFVALCAFRLRSFGLLGVAVFTALLRLSMFYYQYGTSLLWKSAIMLMLGVALVAGGITLQKRVVEAT
jgi:hypothetical protein